MNQIRYDSWGRMYYNPEFHSNNGKPWSTKDLRYLIDWYDIAGAEEMSFALERTIKTIQMKVYSLRKQGVMNRPNKSTKHKRIKKELPKQPKENY